MKSLDLTHQQNCGSRSGVAKLWLILFLPLFVLMLAVVIDIGNLWLARAELETSLEAAALAAVKEWGGAGGGTTLTARQVGQTFATANPVRGAPVTLNLNYTSGGSNNENTASTFPPTTANLIFGSITSISPTVVFSPSTVPTCSLGTVLLDSHGGPSLEASNSWGINFQAPNSTAFLTLSKVEFDLRFGGDPDAVFTVDVTPPVISSPATQTVSGSAVTQGDVFGLDSGALSASTVGSVTTWSNTQVSFVFDSTTPYLLTITFQAAGIDSGFSPGDRIRPRPLVGRAPAPAGAVSRPGQFPTGNRRTGVNFFTSAWSKALMATLGIGTEANGGFSDHAGDGGIVGVFKDASGQVIATTGPEWRAQTFYTAPILDLACPVETGALRLSSACSTQDSNDGSAYYGLHWPRPDGWVSSAFDDADWPQATAFTNAEVGVNNKPAYTNFTDVFDDAQHDASFIWSTNLVLDNEVLVRHTVDAQTAIEDPRPAGQPFRLVMNSAEGTAMLEPSADVRTEEVTSVQVEDAAGRLVFERNGPVRSIDISGLRPGLYVLRVGYRGRAAMIRFLR